MNGQGNVSGAASQPAIAPVVTGLPAKTRTVTSAPLGQRAEPGLPPFLAEPRGAKPQFQTRIQPPQQEAQSTAANWPASDD